MESADSRVDVLGHSASLAVAPSAAACAAAVAAAGVAVVAAAATAAPVAAAAAYEQVDWACLRSVHRHSSPSPHRLLVGAGAVAPGTEAFADVVISQLVVVDIRLDWQQLAL